MCWVAHTEEVYIRATITKVDGDKWNGSLFEQLVHRRLQIEPVRMGWGKSFRLCHLCVLRCLSRKKKTNLCSLLSIPSCRFSVVAVVLLFFCVFFDARGNDGIH